MTPVELADRNSVNLLEPSASIEHVEKDYSEATTTSTPSIKISWESSSTLEIECSPLEGLLAAGFTSLSSAEEAARSAE